MFGADVPSGREDHREVGFVSASRLPPLTDQVTEVGLYIGP
jgi:hypothetical protein